LNSDDKWAILNPGDGSDDTIVTKTRVDRSDVSINELKTRLEPYTYDGSMTGITGNLTLSDANSKTIIEGDASFNADVTVPDSH
jgi:hypothetical protein